MAIILGRRLAQSVVVLFLASIVVWGMVYLLPGDPAILIAGGDTATPEQIEATRERLGLNRPVHEQYLGWLIDVGHGNFGTSANSRVPVSDLIGARLPATIQLAVAGMLVSMAIALPLGAFAGRRPHSRIAAIIRSYCSISLALPSFWAGILFILVFVQTGWTGLPAVSKYANIFTDPAEALRNLAGPVLVLALLLSGILTRFLSRSIALIGSAEFVRTAVAKGVTGQRLFFRHVLRNASIPVITIFGLQLASVLGGVIVIEAVFNYPGIGLLSVQAVHQRDYPTIQAIVLLALSAFIIVNLIVDLLYVIIDPRVRLDNLDR